MNDQYIDKAVNIIKSGGVIAYPTEAVFGFGCDPLNEKALQRIVSLKNRDSSKGLIVVGASFEHIIRYICLDKIPKQKLREILSIWPGPFTFIMPASANLSNLLTGNRDTIAVRVSSHPVICNICNALNGAIVSTSCNLSGFEPMRLYSDVELNFADKVDMVIHENVGVCTSPTKIIDAITGRILREG
jgi:L-threonylcarbamoyladenylate synthase